jgi:hypothetical protein
MNGLHMLFKIKKATEKWWLVLALLLLTAIVLSPCNPYINPPNVDNGFFLYAGRVILHGGLPYRDVWDSKPPAIFYMDALGLWIGRDTRWGVWFLEFIFIGGASLSGYAVLKKIWQPGAAIFGSLIWMWGVSQIIVTGNLIEEYPLLFNFLALFFFVQSIQYPHQRRYDLLVGASAALSFLFRANNIGVQLSIAVVWVILGMVSRQPRLLLKRAILAAGGCTAILLAAGIYLWFNGILAESLNAAVQYNFFYSGGHLNLLSSITDGFSYLGLPAWLTLAGYLCAVFFTLKDRVLSKAQQWVLLIIVLWPLEIYLSGLSGRGYEHYFVSWSPLIALSCGFLYNKLTDLRFLKPVSQFVNQYATAIFLTLALLAFLLNNDSLASYRRTIKAFVTNPEIVVEKSSPISAYIQENTHSEDLVLMWGEGAAVNYMTHRDAPTAYLWYPFYVNSPLTPALANTYYHDILLKKPVLIIDPYLENSDNFLSLNAQMRNAQLKSRAKDWLSNQPANLLQVLDFFDQNYEFKTTIDRMDVYRLKISK